MKNLFLAALSLLLVAGFSSCGSDDDDLNKTKTVTIEIDGSDNLVINSVVIATSEGETQTYADLEVKEWTKQVTYKGVMAVSASGDTSDDKSGTMHMRIVENGKVVKESNAEGSILTGNVSY